jgi:hypothetical protein
MNNSKLLTAINKELEEYITNYEKKSYKNVKRLAHHNIFEKKNEIKKKYNNKQINRLKPQIDELLKKHQKQIKQVFSKNTFNKTNNNNNNNNSQEFYSFDEQYRSIFDEGMRLYNSNDFNTAFPLLKKAADEGGIPLAATKVATYYLNYEYLNMWSFRSAINCTYIHRSSQATINSTNGIKKNYKTNIGIAYLYLALARYTKKNEILGMISPLLIKTALFRVFSISEKSLKEEIKSIKKSEHGWKGYVKESILDVIKEHNISPTLMKNK